MLATDPVGTRRWGVQPARYKLRMHLKVDSISPQMMKFWLSVHFRILRNNLDTLKQHNSIITLWVTFVCQPPFRSHEINCWSFCPKTHSAVRQLFRISTIIAWSSRLNANRLPARSPDQRRPSSETNLNKFAWAVGIYFRKGKFIRSVSSIIIWWFGRRINYPNKILNSIGIMNSFGWNKAAVILWNCPMGMKQPSIRVPNRSQWA